MSYPNCNYQPLSHQQQSLKYKICRFIMSTIKIMIGMAAFFSGMFFAVIWRSYEQASVDFMPLASFNTDNLYYPEDNVILPNIERPSGQSYSHWLNNEKGLCSKQVPEEVVSFVPKDHRNDYINSSNSSSKMLKSEAEFLKSEIPVVCLVITKGKNKASAVKETWGSHCNEIVFYGSYHDTKIPVVRYSALETSSVSFCKMVMEIHDKYFKRHEENSTAGTNGTRLPAKWLLIASDSSYVVIENVRKYAAPLDPSGIFYLGQPEKPDFYFPAFNSLDSSILLSRGSLDYLTSRFFVNQSSCRKKSFILEDHKDQSKGHEVDLKTNTTKDRNSRKITMVRRFELSLVLLLDTAFDTNKTCVYDTRDDLNRHRFLNYLPESHLIPKSFESWRKKKTFRINPGFDCCSDSAISFHGLSPSEIYLTEYLLYHMAVFKGSLLGLGNHPPDVNTILHDNHHQEINNYLMSGDMEIGKGSVRSDREDDKVMYKKKIRRKKFKSSLAYL